MAGFKRALCLSSMQSSHGPRSVNQVLLVRRQYATITALAPKTVVFRVFWTVVTGTVGFVSYKITRTPARQCAES